jgi:hypothetical protein
MLGSASSPETLAQDRCMVDWHSFGDGLTGGDSRETERSRPASFGNRSMASFRGVRRSAMPGVFHLNEASPTLTVRQVLVFEQDAFLHRANIARSCPASSGGKAGHELVHAIVVEPVARGWLGRVVIAQQLSGSRAARMAEYAAQVCRKLSLAFQLCRRA